MPGKKQAPLKRVGAVIKRAVTKAKGAAKKARKTIRTGAKKTK